MKVSNTDIEGLLVIEPQVFGDNRGYFVETFHQQRYKEYIHDEFIQDNESMSAKGILRGLHFQKEPYSQGKLIRVINGAVLDVVVDLRQGSKTFGKHFSITLSAENKTQLWIPKGFAHGFLSLEDYTIFSYKCTELYNKNSEVCIKWNDPCLGIDWKIDAPIISEKDQKGISFQEWKENL